MNCLTQERAPIMEALEKMRATRLVPFDVPGHKHGRGNPDLLEFLGQRCLEVDVNSMKPLDNLCHPVSVIRDAEILAAEAFGAAIKNNPDAKAVLVNNSTYYGNCSDIAAITAAAHEHGELRSSKT